MSCILGSFLLHSRYHLVNTLHKGAQLQDTTIDKRPINHSPRFFQSIESQALINLNVFEPMILDDYIATGYPINLDKLVSVCRQAKWYLQSVEPFELWHIAALLGNKKDLIALVVDIKQVSVLDFLALGGHWSLFEELVQEYFSIEVVRDHIQTIAQLAAIGGQRAFLAQLRLQYDFDYQQAITVSINGHLEFIDELLVADLHCATVDGMNLLHCAAYCGDKKWLCRLVARGLPIDSSLLDYAVEGGQVQIVKFMLQQGWFSNADLKENASQLLLSAVENNQATMLTYLINDCKLKPTYVYEAFDTLLHRCGQYGSWACYVFLKNECQLPDQTNSLGQTCKEVAAEYGRRYFLKQLEQDHCQVLQHGK